VLSAEVELNIELYLLKENAKIDFVLIHGYDFEVKYD
jgi:hypothetical protein